MKAKALKKNRRRARGSRAYILDGIQTDKAARKSRGWQRNSLFEPPAPSPVRHIVKDGKPMETE